MTISEVKISDVALSQYGFTASASASPVGPKFLRVTDIVPAQINWDAVPYCKIGHKEHQKYRLDIGDIVVARTGTVGHAKLIRKKTDAVFASYLVRFKVVSKKLLPGYLGLIMESKAYRNYVRSALGGTAQPHVNAKKLGGFKFKMPSLQEQKQIVEIMENYNSLVENNQRRISLLEESARLLYRDWFVNKRNILAHQEQCTTLRLANISHNFDKSRVPLSTMERESRQGIYPYYGAASVLDHINGFIFDGRFLLVGEDGTVITESGKPVLQLAEGKFWVNNHAHVLQGSSVSTEFLYCALSNYKISGHITGVAQPKITQKNLNRIEVTFFSDNGLMKKFDNLIKPIIDQKLLLKKQSISLAKARDLLLPRLMGGRINL